MDRTALEGLSRDALLARAEDLRVERPAVLTRAELIDEILTRTARDEQDRRRSRGLLGVARDLLAAVVERGLHLPDAASRLRTSTVASVFQPRARGPVATVTLAEIYAAQGHKDRAISVLDDVLASERDHAVARALRDRIVAASNLPPPMPEEPEPASLETATSPAPRATGPAVADATLAAPKPMLDDAPLPDRYDVDEVVVMPVDPRTAFAYWELRADTLEVARASAPEGALVLRVVAVTATWSGPHVESRDVEVAAARGDWFVRDLPAGAVLRVAVGWRAGELFVPLAVAADVTAPPAVASPVAASLVVAWRGADARPTVVAEPAPAPALAAAIDAHRGVVARARWEALAGGAADGTSPSQIASVDGPPAAGAPTESTPAALPSSRFD